MECKKCGGSGIIEREYISYFTREVAIAVGFPSLEGDEIISIYREQCEYCKGTGIDLERINDE